MRFVRTCIITILLIFFGLVAVVHVGIKTGHIAPPPKKIVSSEPAVPVAQNVQAKPTEEDLLHHCFSIGQRARAVMTDRQKGRAMSDMINNAGKESKDLGWILGGLFENAKDMQESFILAAFKVPQWDDSGMRSQAITVFQDTAYGECIKLVRKQRGL